MSRDSQYTDAILTFMRGTNRPVTISEIVDEVGMARQSAYQWRDRNSRILRQVGKGRSGADAYVLVEDATSEGGNLSATWQTVGDPPTDTRKATGAVVGDDATVARAVRLGQSFHVAAMRLDDDGRTVVTLAGDDGHTTFDVIA